jgi:hypothetical protein
LNNESILHKQLHNKNIAGIPKYFSHGIDGDFRYLIMEYIPFSVEEFI